MVDNTFRLQQNECRAALLERLAERSPARIQLLSGPRQVGKTTLLLELAGKLGAPAVYAAADGPEATVPGFWERLWTRVEETASSVGKAVLLLDEAHLLPGWAARLKGEFDRVCRLRLPVHVVATGSSALLLAAGSRESLAGRFERLTLTHWTAASLATTFGLAPEEAAVVYVRQGAYPGGVTLMRDPARWTAYVRDAIVEPTIGRDLVALAPVRRPALLRQVFGACVASPARILSLQKLQGQLQDAGALETIAHYLALLEEAYLVAALPKFSPRKHRQRSSPPKLVTLSAALLAAAEPRGAPEPGAEPGRFGQWLENACLAMAWNAGQQVAYWREEPFEVDGVLDGSWGAWAIEVKSGRVAAADLRGLLEFTGRHPAYRPLLISDESGRLVAGRAGIPWIDWRRFLLEGPPKRV
ncbi:MAG: ATP-binding protein [Candidatus Riflebacteria bacterium]|nr:ATP-binding protein [Candidatus Riflebacteria bacterium]